VPVEYIAHDGYPGPTYVQMEKLLGANAPG
jgi:hypothetical protein